MAATTFSELIEDLKKVENNIIQLKKKQALKSALKVLGIGFVIYKDIKQQIEVEQTKKAYLLKQTQFSATSFLDAVGNENDSIKASNSFLDSKLEAKLLIDLSQFQDGLQYLEFTLHNPSDIQALSTKSKQLEGFVRRYNVEFEKSLLRKKLANKRREIFLAETELNSLLIGHSYFSSKDFYAWKQKWGQLVTILIDCIKKVNPEPNSAIAINEIVTAYKRSPQEQEYYSKKKQPFNRVQLKTGPHSSSGGNSFNTGLSSHPREDLFYPSCSHQNIIEESVFNVRGEPRRIIRKCASCGKIIETENIGR